MKINRHQILALLLDVIHNISDRDYQERVWINAEGPECDDYDENIDIFFHDGVAIIENYKKFHITDSQHQLLVEFRDALDKFDDDDEHYWPPDFIDSPKWAKIMKMAREVLVAFDYNKAEES